MSILQFNDTLICKAMDSNETIYLGGIKPSANYRLKYGLINIQKSGTIGGSEGLRMNVHGSTDTTSIMASSDLVLISTIQNASNLNTTGAWFGYVRFDFTSSIVMNSSNFYYFSLTANNYTRNGTTYFISVPYAFPENIYTAGITINNYTDSILDFRIFGDIYS